MVEKRRYRIKNSVVCQGSKLFVKGGALGIVKNVADKQKPGQMVYLWPLCQIGYKTCVAPFLTTKNLYYPEHHKTPYIV